MGRNLSCNLLTTMEIRKRSGFGAQDIDYLKEKDGILRDMSRVIDVSKYDVSVFEDGILLNLKLDFINENIYDLVYELYKSPIGNYVLDTVADIYKYDENFTLNKFKELFKIQANIVEYGSDEIYRLFVNDDYDSEDRLYDPLYWAFNDSKYSRFLRIDASAITLWIDCGKIVTENEYILLCLLNKMKLKYFKTPLSKCISFEIIG